MVDNWQLTLTYLNSKAPVTVDINKLASCTTDGASVMVGCESGVTEFSSVYRTS